MKTLFISFSHKDVEIVNLVEEYLSEQLNGYVEIIRYDRDVHYKESFREFMKSIPDQDYVLAIVSDSYLKSYGCLFEVGEVLTEKAFIKKLHFIVLKENDKKYYSDSNISVAAKIYGPIDRITYLNYWQNEYDLIESSLVGLTNAASIEERKKLARISRIKDYDLPAFLSFLNEYKSVPLEQLIATSFVAIVEAVLPKFPIRTGSFDNYHDLLKHYIEEIAATTKTDYNQIILMANVGSHSYGLVVVADIIAKDKQKYRIVLTKGLISQSHATQKTIYVSDVSQSSNYIDAVLQTRSELSVPIIFNSVAIGVINSESTSSDHFSPEIIKKLQNISSKLASDLFRLGYQRNVDYKTIPYVSIPFD